MRTIAILTLTERQNSDRSHTIFEFYSISILSQLSTRSIALCHLAQVRGQVQY